MKSKIIGFIFMALLFAYYLVLDPDLNIISSLPFGLGLITVIHVFVLSAALITMIEVLPRWLVDDGVDEEKEIVKEAMRTSQGSGMIYLGISIRVIAYAVITAGVVSVYLKV